MDSRTLKGRALVIAVALVIAWPAFLRGHHWLDGASWPRDPDHLRNNGQAQAMMDGNWLQDPILTGETTWYPPLMAVLITGVQRITGLPLITISAQGGIWFNLAAVLMLFVAAWRLTGRWGALLCHAAFLYLLSAGLNTYSDVGLSPMIDPINFMLGPWCLALVALRRVAADEAGANDWLLAGLATGICFIGHPSSAMILALTCSALAAVRIARRMGFASALIGLLAFAIPFLALATIVLGPLWSVYGLHARNPGFAWIYGPIALVNVHRTIMDMHPIPFVIALFGIGVAIKHRSTVHQVLLAAFASACFLFLWSSISSEYFLMKRELPIPELVVPSYHFYFFVKALLCFFFALGALAMGAWVWERAHAADRARRRLHSMLQWRSGVGTKLVAASLTLCSVAVGMRWARSADNTYNGIPRGTREPGLLNPYRYILNTTLPEDVFLCGDELASHLLAPAGRKVLATYPVFAGPYVDILPRIADRDSLLTLLHNGDTARFRALAERCGVTRIAIKVGVEREPHPSFRMQPAFTNDTAAVYDWPARPR